MNENPFRRRPFTDISIDSWKGIVLSIAFLALVFLLFYR